jgi:hypothetical protein
VAESRIAIPAHLKGPTLLGIILIAALLDLAFNNRGAIALGDWNMEVRKALPLPHKLWLGGLMAVHLSSLLFARRHVAARWVFGGFALSHALIAYVEATGRFAMVSGVISLEHVLTFIPGLIAIDVTRSEIKWPGAHAVWVGAVVVLYSGMLWNDLPDLLVLVPMTTGAIQS